MKNENNTIFLGKNAAIPRIFPKAKLTRACLIDLSLLAEKMDKKSVRGRFLNANLTDRYLRLLHHAANCDVSYGGYLEDRRALWRGSYLQEDSAVHVGIDINLPAGTKVSVLHPCTVVNIGHDVEMKGGWGSVVMCQLAAPLGVITHFMYAHLSADSICVSIGDYLSADTIVGAIGKTDENGHWYEHLHVQAFTQTAWDKTGGILDDFDGYDQAQKTAEHPLFPNPIALICD